MLGIKRYKWLSLFISVFLCLGWLAVSAYQGYSAAGINTTGSQERADFFKIRVVDSLTGRGVPLVELKTTYEATYKSMMARLPSDPSIITIDSFMVLPDKNGNERLVAFYTLCEHAKMPVEQGLVIFDDEKEIFDERIVLRSSEDEPLSSWDVPGGQALKYEEDGKKYYMFTKEYPDFWPTLRIPATLEEAKVMENFEVFTPVKEGVTMEEIIDLLPRLLSLKVAGYDAKEYEGLDEYFDMDQNGELIWSWKKNGLPASQDLESRFLECGLLDIDGARFQLKDSETLEDVKIYSGTIHWNDYLNEYILIGVGIGEGRVEDDGLIIGNCDLGTVWYAKAPSPVGPWTMAEKVLTHEDYNFFNPVHHPFFDNDDGAAIYFEGTYTAEHTASERALKTPYYDYNQIMYRLELVDPR